MRFTREIWGGDSIPTFIKALEAKGFTFVELIYDTTKVNSFCTVVYERR